MSKKHFVIGLKPSIVDRASASCLRRGTTLKKEVERLIVEQSKIKTADQEAFIQEADVVNEAWAPSRATIYNMRTNGEITEDVHYIVNDGLIFYKLKAFRDFCRKFYPHIETNKAIRNEVITG